MARRKDVRTRGKIPFSRAFQNLEEGDYVAVVREPAMTPRFPKRIQGKTGIIEKKKGRSFVIKINDMNKEKRFIIGPVHLKKIQTTQKA